MSNTLPTRVELCSRIRDGYPCLGRIHRSGVPEVVCCTACGKRGDGVVYTLQPDRAARIVAAAERWAEIQATWDESTQDSTALDAYQAADEALIAATAAVNGAPAAPGSA